MTKDEAREAIKQYFEDNEEVFAGCVETLDNYNGYLDYNHYYDMNEFDDYFCGSKPSEIASTIHYGHDEDDGAGSEFNPNRAWFRFDGCGNIVSSSTRDYSEYIDDDVVEELSSNRRHIWEIGHYSELGELFDIYDNDGDDEDDGEGSEDNEDGTE